MDFIVTGIQTCFFLFCAWAFLVFVVPKIIESLKESAKAREKKRAEEEDARFRLEHPEAWRAKEIVKLERERLEAQKQLADQYQRQENSRRNVGLVAGIIRGFFG